MPLTYTAGNELLSRFLAIGISIGSTAVKMTFQPYRIGRGYRMLMLEKLISHLRDRDAVFMTMREAAQEFDRREPYVAGGKTEMHA